LEEQAAAGHPWSKHASVSALFQSIKGGKVGAVITGGYLLVYDYGPTLYSYQPILIEHLVIKLRPQGAGDFNAVTQALDELARRHGCVGIFTGNAVGRAGLTRLYERSGFHQVTVGLYKEM